MTGGQMYFASDNGGPVHPAVLAALAKANDGYAPGYGADALTAHVTERLRAVFEAPQAAVYLVTTGTAANVLALSCLARPWTCIFCTDVAHIHEDECNAPGFFSGGATLSLIAQQNAKMTVAGLERNILAEGTRGVHGPARGPVSITQATERGTIYSLAEIAALSALARSYSLPVHLDGARFANALVRLGCSPADMTWKAGVDAVSFGGTKNGLLGVEAVILFDPAQAMEFELRRKRGAHLISKHRYLAAQMAAYLEGDLWLTMARSANAALDRLVAGLRAVSGVALVWEPEANLVFFRAPRVWHQRMQAAGAVYYLYEGPLETGDPLEPLMARLVCDWSMTDAVVDQFLDLARG